MDISGDELAGIADLFGGLTRAELAEACAELAYKRGEEYDPERFEPAIDEAIEGYALIRVVPEGVEGVSLEEPVYVPGPVAFPELPDGATDLVHIFDIEERDVDREAARIAAVEMFREDLAGALESGDAERQRELVDVSYELEAWGTADLADERERLDPET